MNFLFNQTPFWQEQAIGLVRIILGIFLIYHGHEVFQSSLMEEYAKWDAFKNMNGTLMVYLGKGAEFVIGIFFLLGLLTRLGALLCMGTFLYITFFIGSGKFWYQDQHPFMFALFGFLYFFIGAGAWSVDKILFKNK